MTAPAATHRFSTRTAGLLAAAGLAAALPAAANAATGGTFSSVAPTVTAVECLTSCSGIDVVRPGGTIRLTGRDLGTARTAAFRGRAGSADDVTAPILRRTATTATVAVPAGARTGPLAVINSDGLASAARLTVAIDRGAGSAPAGAAVEAKVATRTVFYAGRTKARLSYVLQSPEPASKTRNRPGNPIAAYPISSRRRKPVSRILSACLPWAPGLASMSVSKPLKMPTYMPIL